MELDKIKSSQENEFIAIMKNINLAAEKGLFSIFCNGDISPDTKQQLATIGYETIRKKDGTLISWEYVKSG